MSKLMETVRFMVVEDMKTFTHTHTQTHTKAVQFISHFVSQSR
jgi:hypothetical protein